MPQQWQPEDGQGAEDRHECDRDGQVLLVAVAHRAHGRGAEAPQMEKPDAINSTVPGRTPIQEPSQIVPAKVTATVRTMTARTAGSKTRIWVTAS